MRKFREVTRYLGVLFSMGFIFGILLECTLFKTVTIDIRFGIIWGFGACLLSVLNEYTTFIINQKKQMRKEEQSRMVEEINEEISSLKEKIPKLIMTQNNGDAHLASIYIDRVILLEKLKCEYEMGKIPNHEEDKASLDSDYT